MYDVLDQNYLAVAVAGVAAVLLSTVYYMFFAKQMAGLHPAYADTSAPPPWKITVELIRSVVIAAVLGGFVARLGLSEWSDGVVLGVAMWALPVVLLSGSVIWENVPPKLAAIHAGDWLLKLVVVSTIVTLWQPVRPLIEQL
jgi:hypothetical protein